MKALVVSDSHGMNANLLELIDRVSPFDMFIHMGDICGGAAAIEKRILEKNPECEIYIVAGNNDIMSGYRKIEVFEFGRHTVVITHGHRHGVNYGFEGLEDLAFEYGADIVMYGHTHVPVISRTSEGLMIMNPGSISLPRQYPRRPSYIVLETAKIGDLIYGIHYFEKK